MRSLRGGSEAQRMHANSGRSGVVFGEGAIP
jgi:hypothetical protein